MKGGKREIKESKEGENVDIREGLRHREGRKGGSERGGKGGSERGKREGRKEL